MVECQLGTQITTCTESTLDSLSTLLRCCSGGAEETGRASDRYPACSVLLTNALLVNFRAQIECTKRFGG